MCCILWLPLSYLDHLLSPWTTTFLCWLAPVHLHYHLSAWTVSCLLVLGFVYLEYSGLLLVYMGYHLPVWVTSSLPGIPQTMSFSCGLSNFYQKYNPLYLCLLSNWTTVCFLGPTPVYLDHLWSMWTSFFYLYCLFCIWNNCWKPGSVSIYVIYLMSMWMFRTSPRRKASQLILNPGSRSGQPHLLVYCSRAGQVWTPSMTLLWASSSPWAGTYSN